MANKMVFGNAKNAVPVADTLNNAGGKAYKMSDRHALAQIAATNTFNDTFYASGMDNLKLAKEVAGKLRGNPEFIAKTALYCREKGHMKDMAAFLTVVLAGIDTTLFRRVFPRTINNGKMLRNFFQIARSGEGGKVFNMSSGAVRHALRDWFNAQTPTQLLNASVGNDPTMRDMLRMSHPRPKNEEYAALFAYLDNVKIENGKLVILNKAGEALYSHDANALPQVVRDYEMFKLGCGEGETPKIDFRLLDGCKLTTYQWSQIALNSPYQMVRMNLNTFARHGVLKDDDVVKGIVKKLRDPEQIKAAGLFPYQLMAAYVATQSNKEIPNSIKGALQDAMEIAVSNVPRLEGKVFLCVDTSGSMKSPVTGNRGSATTTIRCVDVAALFASSVLRNNPDAVVVPFDTKIHNHDLNPRDTVVTNASKLARYGGGGTDCGSALRFINTDYKNGDVVIFISDNESWVDRNVSSRATTLTNAWAEFKQNNKGAKLVCIDLTPRDNEQVRERKDVLFVGGYSDSVMDTIDNFIKFGGDNVNHWVAEIEKVVI